MPAVEWPKPVFGLEEIDDVVMPLELGLADNFKPLVEGLTGLGFQVVQPGPRAWRWTWGWRIAGPMLVMWRLGRRHHRGRRYDGDDATGSRGTGRQGKARVFWPGMAGITPHQLLTHGRIVAFPEAGELAGHLDCPMVGRQQVATSPGLDPWQAAAPRSNQRSPGGATRSRAACCHSYSTRTRRPEGRRSESGAAASKAWRCLWSRVPRRASSKLPARS